MCVRYSSNVYPQSGFWTKTEKILKKNQMKELSFLQPLKNRCISHKRVCVVGLCQMFYLYFSKDVNEYLNQYSNIRMGIRIIFEYSMVNNIIFSTVTRLSRKLMTSTFINQMAATRFSELSKVFFRVI